MKVTCDTARKASACADLEIIILAINIGPQLIIFLQLTIACKEDTEKMPIFPR